LFSHFKAFYVASCAILPDAQLLKQNLVTTKNKEQKIVLLKKSKKRLKI